VLLAVAKTESCGHDDGHERPRCYLTLAPAESGCRRSRSGAIFQKWCIIEKESRGPAIAAESFRYGDVNQ